MALQGPSDGYQSNFPRAIPRSCPSGASLAAVPRSCPSEGYQVNFPKSKPSLGAVPRRDITDVPRRIPRARPSGVSLGLVPRARPSGSSLGRVPRACPSGVSLGRVPRARPSGASLGASLSMSLRRFSKTIVIAILNWLCGFFFDCQSGHRLKQDNLLIYWRLIMIILCSQSRILMKIIRGNTIDQWMIKMPKSWL